MSDKLLKKMPDKYITHFVMFSARTSANQTQDYIDSKLDKRWVYSITTVQLSAHDQQSNNMFVT